MLTFIMLDSPDHPMLSHDYGEVIGFVATGFAAVHCISAVAAEPRARSVEAAKSVAMANYTRQCLVLVGGLDKIVISFPMSSARHAVQRAVSFTGFGNRPDRTPSHQHVFPRGITVNT